MKNFSYISVIVSVGLIAYFVSNILWGIILDKKLDKHPTVYTTNVFFLDNTASQFKAEYNWSIIGSISEEDRSKIDLLVNRTIKKFFVKYSVEEFKTNFELQKDLLERIEDVISTVYPIEIAPILLIKPIE